MVTQTEHCAIIYPDNFLPGISAEPQLKKIISFATKASLHVYGSDWFYAGNKRNKRRLSQLAEVENPLFVKTHFRPVVVGRFLCFHSLNLLGWKNEAIGKFFGVHRTTVINGLSVIQDRKFKPDVNDAFEYYNEISR